MTLKDRTSPNLLGSKSPNRRKRDNGRDRRDIFLVVVIMVLAGFIVTSLLYIFRLHQAALLPSSWINENSFSRKGTKNERQIWLASMIRNAGDIHDIMFRQLMKLNCVYGIHLHFLLGSQEEANAFEERRKRVVSTILNNESNNDASIISKFTSCGRLVIEVEPNKQSLSERCFSRSGSGTSEENEKDLFPFLSSPGVESKVSDESATREEKLRENSERVQRISFWRHYQRRSLKRAMYPYDNDRLVQRQHLNGVDDIVILLDADMVSLGEYSRNDEDILNHFIIEVRRIQEGRKKKNKEDHWHVICALGVECKERYYDIFATVAWPETFVYPLAGRWAMSIKNFTYMEKENLVTQLFPLQNRSFVMHNEHYSVPNEHNVGHMTQVGFRNYLINMQKQQQDQQLKNLRESRDMKSSLSLSMFSSISSPVRIRSCFGGVTIYRADIFFCPGCDYAHLRHEDDSNMILEKGDSIHNFIVKNKAYLELPPEYKEDGDILESESTRPSTLEAMNATELRLKYAERFGQLCEHVLFHECLHKHYNSNDGNPKTRQKDDPVDEIIDLRIGIQPQMQPRYHGNGGLIQCSMPP